MQSRPPLFSIVIANYNYGRFLEEAILSVLNQSCPDFELIIVDGGSSDNSVEIIKKYQDRVAWWCSEKDRGQSHAFNKGFARAQGRFLTWLNADDILVPEAVSSLQRAHARWPDCQWFTGNFLRFIDSTKAISEVSWGPHVYPEWLQSAHSPVVVFGPSSFFSKEIFVRAGGVDESFHLMMDIDLWVRFQVMGIRQRRLNRFLFAFRMHEASKTAEFGDHSLSDEQAERLKNEQRAMVEKTGYVYWPLMRILLLGLRVLDGSFTRRYWLKCKLVGHDVDSITGS